MSSKSLAGAIIIVVVVLAAFFILQPQPHYQPPTPEPVPEPPSQPDSVPASQPQPQTTGIANVIIHGISVSRSGNLIGIRADVENIGTAVAQFDLRYTWSGPQGSPSATSGSNSLESGCYLAPGRRLPYEHPSAIVGDQGFYSIEVYAEPSNLLDSRSNNQFNGVV